ncbi:MAG: bifunctional serine/threonine-protein kinase/formylglycine-generating enzyme family protein [Verrucomicrobia bacterium]|nr:bifunctional serine/threonine-protein kinase/formylglycine-generating enzyme family protein [Verrucomicrobiota bacterium]
MNEDQPREQREPGTSSSSSTTPASTQLDYQLLRLIGRGAYGEVWLARDRQGAYCAVKVVFRESFDHDRPYEREYEGIRKFEPVSRSYDHQVQILHVARQDEQGRFYYIMELADDQRTGQKIDPRIYEPKTLKSELKKLGRFPVEECLRVGLALTGALENLHQHGLIHRDTKPGNIIFVKGVPKLADIGLVTDRAVSVSYVGTEGYIPPEGPSSAQADIFSLGKVLYEMATGRDRMDFPELPTDLQELPDHEALLKLNAVIAKACARDPRQRYESARAMFADLARVQKGKSLRHHTGLRRGLLVTAKLVACAALLAAAAWSVHRLVIQLHRPKLWDPWKNARKEHPWTNSLGMRFVPGEGTKVLFSIWDTRVKDYAAYANTNSGVDSSWRKVDYWGLPVSEQPDHPVTMVSWEDAKAFCKWLTEKEWAAGILDKSQYYRLPTDAEWSLAVSLDEPASDTAKDKQGTVYPWGTVWPPPRGAGNFADVTLKRMFRNTGFIEGYDDGYAATSPVGSFESNRFGLYDMGGNVCQWCEDGWKDGDQKYRVSRGSSWRDGDPMTLLSFHRVKKSADGRDRTRGVRCVLATGEVAVVPNKVNTNKPPP